MRGLVLSLFPGLGLLDAAFEEAGFCVVRGPDKLFGEDIRGWHVLPNRFDGVIGGPPCKAFSRAKGTGNPVQGNLIPEFERIVREAEPKWWVMENVVEAPTPELEPCHAVKFDAWEVGARQHRTRRFSSNLPLHIQKTPLSERDSDPWPCVTATEDRYSKGDSRRAGRKVNRKMTLGEVAWAFELPENKDLPDFSKLRSLYQLLGNGVPLSMGRAVAQAVIEAIGD